MAEAAQVPQQLRDEMTARYTRTLVEPVELGRVRDYLQAMDEPADLGPGDPVPPLFLLTIARTRRPQPSRGTAVKAGDEYRFQGTVRVGDTLTINQRLADIQVKQGKNGPMYLITAEAVYKNQHGQTVCVQRAKSLRWGQ